MKVDQLFEAKSKLPQKAGKHDSLFVIQLMNHILDELGVPKERSLMSSPQQTKLGSTDAWYVILNDMEVANQIQTWLKGSATLHRKFHNLQDKSIDVYKFGRFFVGLQRRVNAPTRTTIYVTKSDPKMPRIGYRVHISDDHDSMFFMVINKLMVKGAHIDVDIANPKGFDRIKGKLVWAKGQMTKLTRFAVQTRDARSPVASDDYFFLDTDADERYELIPTGNKFLITDKKR